MGESGKPEDDDDDTKKQSKPKLTQFEIELQRQGDNSKAIYRILALPAGITAFCTYMNWPMAKAIEWIPDAEILLPCLMMLTPVPRLFNHYVRKKDAIGHPQLILEYVLLTFPALLAIAFKLMHLAVLPRTPEQISTICFVHIPLWLGALFVNMVFAAFCTMMAFNSMSRSILKLIDLLKGGTGSLFGAMNQHLEVTQGTVQQIKALGQIVDGKADKRKRKTPEAPKQ